MINLIIINYEFLVWRVEGKGLHKTPKKKKKIMNFIQFCVTGLARREPPHYQRYHPGEYTAHPPHQYHRTGAVDGGGGVRYHPRVWVGDPPKYTHPT